jgi:hypothetical protein
VGGTEAETTKRLGKPRSDDVRWAAVLLAVIFHEFTKEKIIVETVV